jgi:hypothetical protein
MRKGLRAAVAAATLLAAPSLAAADETFGSLGFITIPGAPLTSFDISWVDQLENAGAPGLNTYFLADRSNASIDLFHIQVNPVPSKLIVPAPNQFAGNVPTCPIANACNGPNGVMTLLNPGSGAKELWAGDGPTMTPGIGTPVCPTTCSTVKVFNSNGVLTHVINTGGIFRADEFCFSPVGPGGHGVVLVANDADLPPFVTMIATDGPNAYQVIGKFQIPQATNGIEQCQFNAANDVFYLNIPEWLGPGDDSVHGAVLVFFSFVNVAGGPFLPPFFVDINSCAGPQGMAMGPPDGVNGANFILLGCNANTPGATPPFSGPSNSVVVFAGNPSAIAATFVGQGGADQVWMDQVTNHYFVTGGSLLPAQAYNINDANTNTQDQNIFIGFTGATTRRAHSTATWSGFGLGSTVTAAFLPVPATGGSATAPFSSTVCGFSATQGCIAVFGAVPAPFADPDN